MGYNTKELEKLALEAIEEHEIPFINHLVAYMPCSRQTFYDHGLDKIDTIVDSLSKQKITKKTKLLNKMLDSDNATCYTTAYKLLSDDKEFSKLSGQQVDHTSKGDKIAITINKNYNGDN